MEFLKHGSLQAVRWISGILRFERNVTTNNDQLEQMATLQLDIVVLVGSLKNGLQHDQLEHVDGYDKDNKHGCVCGKNSLVEWPMIQNI